MNMQMWYFVIKIFILKSQGYTSNKNIGESGSDDKKIGEFVLFNVFERQKPSKVLHGKITDGVII